MTAESSCRCELAELMTDHVFNHIYRNVLSSVMHCNGVTDKFREDRGSA